MIRLEAVGRNRANRLVTSIADLCRRFPTQEKWLLVPGYRLGYQWLENVALGGVAVFNLRLFTLPSLALRLASRAMQDQGLRYVQGLEYDLLVGQLLSRALPENGYLPRNRLEPELVRAVRRTLSDLRKAGLRPKDLDTRAFSPPRKGHELKALLAGLQEELQRRKLADYADVLRMARQALQRGNHPWPEGLRIAAPGDLESDLVGLERKLWEKIPAPLKEVLEVDRPGSFGEEGSDVALLGWLGRPHQAPPPAGDGAVRIFRAVGETNEVREVLRRCLREGIPADRVEILHTDYGTYVPRLFELCSLLFPDPGGDPPATFAEGLPLRLTRPGRALLGWIRWLREDLSPQRLAELVQDGLLHITAEGEDEGRFDRLAALLRALPIPRGRDGYDLILRSPTAEIPPPPETEGENGPSPAAALRPEPGEMELLRELCAGLLATVPGDPSDAPGLLRGAEELLSRWVRALDKADQFALHLLRRRVREFQLSIEGSGPDSLPALDWLEDLVRSSRVLGEGPRPGRLHVAPLGGGGSSGRPVTFILGLDDGRFPGAGLQDPLLLDSERESLSPSLATAADRLAASLEELSSLFSRLRGKVTLSCSGYQVTEDREMFPSQALVTSFRLLTKSLTATQEDLLLHLADPASFATRDPEDALLPSEWWLSTLGGSLHDPDHGIILPAHFPHLWRGLQAARARRGEGFTAYDGYVPEAGRDLDPKAEGGPVVSASRLETYGRCPLEYFFRYVLEVTPPEEYGDDPGTWLSPLERGNLLHTVFRRFHQGLSAEGRSPSTKGDWHILENILREEVARWRRMKPPPSPRALEEEVRELERTARIFLQEEELCCREREPVYLEVAVGMEREGLGNPIDRAEPLEIRLPGGERIRVRGRIDRVDRLRASTADTFLVCDYKTGSSGGYDPSDPFGKGRFVQNYLYKVMAEDCLRGLHPEARVAGFEYFFPGTRAHGERIYWESDLLSEGDRVLHDLYLSLAAGCFPASDDPHDMRYSDFLPALGDPDEAAASARMKLENTANQMLEPLRRLRGYGEVKR